MKNPNQANVIILNADQAKRDFKGNTKIVVSEIFQGRTIDQVVKTVLNISDLTEKQIRTTLSGLKTKTKLFTLATQSEYELLMQEREDELQKEINAEKVEAAKSEDINDTDMDSAYPIKKDVTTMGSDFTPPKPVLNDARHPVKTIIEIQAESNKIKEPKIEVKTLTEQDLDKDPRKPLKLEVSVKKVPKKKRVDIEKSLSDLSKCLTENANQKVEIKIGKKYLTVKGDHGSVYIYVSKGSYKLSVEGKARNTFTNVASEILNQEPKVGTSSDCFFNISPSDLCDCFSQTSS